MSTTETITDVLERELVARIADYLILARFDSHRGRMYGDMARARRQGELNRLGDELVEAGAFRGNLLEETGLFAGYGFPVPAARELIAAWDRIATPRIRRLERETYRAGTRYTRATREAWDRVAAELNELQRGAAPTDNARFTMSGGFTGTVFAPALTRDEATAIVRNQYRAQLPDLEPGEAWRSHPDEAAGIVITRHREERDA